jgi:F0F1-type ATP synthase delta subunit
LSNMKVNKTDQLAEKLIQILENTQDQSILKALLRKLSHKFGDGVIQIRYAGALIEGQKELLEKEVRRRFPEMKEIKYTYDESLIAGIKIIYDDFVYEDSVKRNFQSLAVKF